MKNMEKSCVRALSIGLALWCSQASFAEAQYSLYNKTCTDVALNALSNINKPQSCRASVAPSSMPSCFNGLVKDKTTGADITENVLSKQDETSDNYTDYDDFKNQLDRFLATDSPGQTGSKDSACQWLFWSNGVMRRPYSGTLCAIAKNQDFIKRTAAKYGIPPEYLACAIGGDSMIVGGDPDRIAKNQAGAPQTNNMYVMDLVQSRPFENSKSFYNGKGSTFRFDGTTSVEQLIEKMAVIGYEAKQKYLGVYGKSDLSFGKGSEHEAEILATIYNKGVDRCNPSPSREPTFNYFGLSCARMMKVYKLHLNGNPSKDACL